MHRSPSGRVIAVLLAFLASFTAPGAALAHGAAHHREHHGDHATPTSARHGVHDVHDVHEHANGHSHRDSATVQPVVADDQPAADVAVGSRAAVSHRAPDDSHSHPTLDLPVRPRVELAVILPLVIVAALAATPETGVAGSLPVPHAALARPDPDAAPPPRTRAPPHR